MALRSCTHLSSHLLSADLQANLGHSPGSMGVREQQGSEELCIQLGPLRLWWRVDNPAWEAPELLCVLLRPRALSMFPPISFRGRKTLPQQLTVPAVSSACFCCLARSLCSTTESPWLLNPYLVHINPPRRGRVRR